MMKLRTSLISANGDEEIGGIIPEASSIGNDGVANN